MTNEGGRPGQTLWLWFSLPPFWRRGKAGLVGLFDLAAFESPPLPWFEKLLLGEKLEGLFAECRDEKQRMAAVKIRDHGNKFYRTDFPGHEGHRALRRDITLDTGRTRYTLRYTVCTSHRERWVPLEGFLGLPEPTPVNWYSEGFLEAWANGVNLGAFKPRFVGPVDEGKKGVVDLVWRATPGWFGGRYIGWARARFLALPKGSNLLCEFSLQPEIPVTEFIVCLQALPCYRTSLTVAPGRRKAVTSVRELIQPELEGPVRADFPLDLRREFWLLLCDEVFDKAKEKGVGPCALLFLPEQAMGAKVTVTHYFVRVKLDAKPEVGTLRLAIWELPHLSNQAAFSFLKASAGATLSLLRTLSFLPPSLEEFNRQEAERETEGILARLRDWPREAELRNLPREIESLLPHVLRAAKRGCPDIVRELEAVTLLIKFRRLLDEARAQAGLTI